ncbi:hypothetical protein RRG08_029039 [Elysia crispata]|uniref:MAM domain-containing protein n=1 Tax=Elysia crispata TaxID=231223 RepID=A0AAE1AIF1_9GAST|nr:hypothetical protein RRG08_029039 [Elysia crispata]
MRLLWNLLGFSILLILSLFCTAASSAWPLQKFRCDFAKGWCGWKPDAGQFPWLRKKGQTVTNSTGPSQDHTQNKGDTTIRFYALMSAAGRNQGSRAKMTNGPWPLDKENRACLQLYYYMYGDQMGRLAMNVRAAGKWYEMFTLEGNKGRHWIEMKRIIVNQEKVPIDITVSLTFR